MRFSLFKLIALLSLGIVIAALIGLPNDQNITSYDQIPEIYELGNIEGIEQKSLSVNVSKDFKLSQLVLKDELLVNLQDRLDICRTLKKFAFKGDVISADGYKLLILPKIKSSNANSSRKYTCKYGGSGSNLKNLILSGKVSLAINSSGELFSISKKKPYKKKIISHYEKELYDYPRALIHPNYCKLPLEFKLRNQQLTISNVLF